MYLNTNRETTILLYIKGGGREYGDRQALMAGDAGLSLWLVVLGPRCCSWLVVLGPRRHLHMVVLGPHLLFMVLGPHCHWWVLLGPRHQLWVVWLGPHHFSWVEGLGTGCIVRGWWWCALVVLFVNGGGVPLSVFMQHSPHHCHGGPVVTQGRGWWVVHVCIIVPCWCPALFPCAGGLVCAPHVLISTDQN